MSNTTYIGKKVRKFDSAPQFDGYSRVVITVTEELEYSAGDDTGRALTLECPWGTQAMADNILASIKGFKYQPYAATDALLDPATELGDGVNVNGTYGGIYTQETKFGPLCTASVSAPSEEEIDHEYPYTPKSDRKITRKLYDLSSELKVRAGEISAKVSKTGGDSSTFGWELDAKSWTLKSNGSNVLYASKDGVEISGKITATSGKIGGFNIESDHLSYNGMTWGGTEASGIYIGPNGIQLGANFKVDSSGNLTAASGTFSGFVKAGNIQYGDENGTFSGAGLTSHSISGTRLQYNTVSTSYTSGGINTSLGYADYSHLALNGLTEVAILQARKVIAGFLTYKTYDVEATLISYKDSTDSIKTIRVLTCTD